MTAMTMSRYADGSRTGSSWKLQAVAQLPLYATMISIALGLIVGSSTFPSAMWALGALVLFLVFVVTLARRAPFSFVVLAPLLVLRITEFISGAAIESGAYMIEVSRYGAPTGAFARLLFLDLLFFMLITGVLESVWPRLCRFILQHEARWTARLDRARLLVLVALALLTLFVAYLGITYGFPLINNEDRFHFLWRIDSSAYKAFITNRGLLTPFMGLLLLVPKHRRWALASYAWLIVVSLLFGEKFTSLVLLSVDFVLPFGILFVARGGVVPVRFMLLTGLGLTCLTVPAVLLAYGGGSNLEIAVRRFEDRVTLQGQLWFLADSKYPNLVRFDGSALKADAATWLVPSAQDPVKVGTSFGLYYVMQDYTHGQILRWIMETGNGFVFATQPYLLKATGYVGAVFIMNVVALYHVIVIVLLTLAYFQVNVVAMLAVARVNVFLLALYIEPFFWQIFGIKTLAALLVAAIALYMGRYGSPHRSRIGPVLQRGRTASEPLSAVMRTSMT